MVKLELSKDEIRTLQGVLLVEQSDLNDLINTIEDKKDRTELKHELVNVN